MQNSDWFVYLLLCNKKQFYVGITNQLKKRYHEHKTKQSPFTVRFDELELVYCERYSNKFQVASREKQLKGWSRTKKQMLIEGRLGINSCTEFAEAILKG
jgi:putative endonuclease